MTTEEADSLRREWDKERYRADALKKELDTWKSYGYLAIAGVAFFALAKCEGDEIKVSADTRDVVIHSWSWWGLSREETPIFWRDNQWMAKDKKGEWYVAVAEPEDDPPD